MRILAAAVLLSMLLAPATAHGATIEVHPGEGTPLQDALDAAQSGDTIVINKGVYNESVTLDGGSNITIVGKGRPVIDGGGDNTDTVRIDNVDGLTITGVTIRNADDDALDLRYCSNVLITKCTFEDCGDSGIEDIESDGITIEKNRFNRTDWGIALSWNDAEGSAGIRIIKNRFTTIYSVGIEFSGSDAVVEKNTFKDLQGDGIVVDDIAPWTNALIEKNRITADPTSSGDGITLNGSAHRAIKNSVKKIQGDGFVVAGTGGHTLEKNKAVRSGDSAFDVNSTANTFTKNKGKKSGSVDLDSLPDESANTWDGNKFGTERYGD